MRKLMFYPEVVDFLEEDKDEFPYVEARYAYGSPPKLIMLDKESSNKSLMRLDEIRPCLHLAKGSNVILLQSEDENAFCSVVRSSYKLASH
jgi:predicted DNA-binding protein (MmcQ/YjbR family)